MSSDCDLKPFKRRHWLIAVTRVHTRDRVGHCINYWADIRNLTQIDEFKTITL